jgi:fungal STAND N-terminal Goodbye domain
MSSMTSSTSNFQLISKALSDYANQTGIDLTKNPFADKLHSCDSADAISELLQERAKAFKTYRDGHRKLINCLSPIVQLIHAFSGTLGEALVLVSSSESIPLFPL